MAGMVLLGGGGIKSAVALACCGQDADTVLLHVEFGQLSGVAEWEATERCAERCNSAQAVRIQLPYPLQLQQALGASLGSGGAEAVSGAVGTNVLQDSSLQGFWPALVWAGVHCAVRVGATRVISGLSRVTGNAHVGLARVEGRPDQTRELVHALGIAAEMLLPSGSSVAIETPLLERSYADIVKLAFHMNVPVDQTWTCCKPPGKARGRAVSCGRCPTCVARAEGFAAARFTDPLVPDARRSAAGAV